MTARRRRPVARFTWWEDEPKECSPPPTVYTIYITRDPWQMQSLRVRLLNWIQRRIATMTNELIPMADPLTDPRPNTFIAVEVEVPDDASVMFVGTFVGWSNSHGPSGPRSMLLEEVTSGERVDILDYIIVRAWWAPMGYRA